MKLLNMRTFCLLALQAFNAWAQVDVSYLHPGAGKLLTMQ